MGKIKWIFSDFIYEEDSDSTDDDNDDDLDILDLQPISGSNKVCFPQLLALNFDSCHKKCLRMCCMPFWQPGISIKIATYELTFY